MSTQLTEQGAHALVGQTVGGRFLVTRLLATGGMAVVYEAEQRIGESTRKVALKTLRIHAAQDPSLSLRFKRECDTIAQLSHPNIVRVYDFGQTEDGMLYIAMEFVAGKALSEIMASGPMPPARVLTILQQITGALQEAHAQGVVHRDLKPDNVVIQILGDQQDTVKLLDFGIAARTMAAEPEGKLTQQGMVLGTPPYMSPEQFKGGSLDARSDIYALGVMSYEMLTGHLPLQAGSPWQWANAHMKEAPIPFETVKSSFEIPSPMRHAIMRALSKSPEARQESVKQFFEELSATSTTSPMDVPPPFQIMGGTTPMPARAALSHGPGSVGAAAYTPPPPSVLQSTVSQRGGRRMIGWITFSVILLAMAGGAAIYAPRLLTPDDPPPPYPAAVAPSNSNAGHPDEESGDSPVQRDIPANRPQRPPARPLPAHPTPTNPPATPAPTEGAAGAPAVEPATPLGAFQCQSDAQCGFHRCNTEAQRCILPCTSDNDCRAGAQCKTLLGVGACVPATQAAPAAPAAPAASTTPSPP